MEQILTGKLKSDNILTDILEDEDLIHDVVLLEGDTLILADLPKSKNILNE